MDFSQFRDCIKRVNHLFPGMHITKQPLWSASHVPLTWPRLPGCIFGTGWSLIGMCFWHSRLQQVLSGVSIVGLNCWCKNNNKSKCGRKLMPKSQKFSNVQDHLGCKSHSYVKVVSHLGVDQHGVHMNQQNWNFSVFDRFGSEAF